MRIIAGSARRLQLEVPPGLGVRPTADRAREALFSSLGPCDGLRVLDLFAGSGALGLEAASRGALTVTAIERDPGHFRVLEANQEKVRRSGIPGTLRALRGDALACRFWPQPLDLIFADPPYAESAAAFRQLLAEPLFPLRAAGALLIWELPDGPGAAGEFLTAATGLAESTVRRFGGTDFLLARIPRKEG